jgi:hypothetical protein
MTDKTIQKKLFKKILQFPTEKITEVEDFVAFLLTRKTDRQLTREAQQLSEPVFAADWDNDRDAD